MKDLVAEFQDAEISEIEEESNKDAARVVVAFSLSMIIILASSIAILYIWKGEDLVIERPSPALSSWEKEYKSLTGVSNQSLSGLDGEGVVLCVVDSGIDLSHPDLSDLVLKGWLDSVNGLDDPYDDEGHGTAMSGIIVADGGLKGVSKGVDLLDAKAIDDEGQGDSASVANSVDWCVQQGADIISLSLGGGQSFGSGFLSLIHI